MITQSLRAPHVRATGRLIDARGSVREAFDRLGTGLTFDDLIAYIEPGFHAIAVYKASTLEDAHARLVGLIAAAALTIVESDRARRP